MLFSYRRPSHCNTSLSKNYVAHSVTSLSDRLNFGRKTKKKFVCTLCAYKINRRVDFSTNLHSTTRPLKHSPNFESVENVQSLNVVEFEFELCHIPNDAAPVFN